MGQPAKLRIPTLAANVVMRERLFGLLDGAQNSRAVWISSPPGSGKTVLAQTWVQSRHRLALWYRVDAADRDPALLPVGLELAARHMLDGRLAGGAPKLPLLTPERRGSLASFASDFFSPLFDAMATAAGIDASVQSPSAAQVKCPVLIFDNLDEALGGDEFDQLVASAIECVEPCRMQVICIARSEPTGPFARLHAHEDLTALSFRHLRTTDEEAAKVLGSGSDSWAASVNRGAAKRANHWCNGWISGLAVLRQSERELVTGWNDLSATQSGTTGAMGNIGIPDMTAWVSRSGSREVSNEAASVIAADRVADYLGKVVLANRPPAQREMLMAGALMPTFTKAMMEAVSGQQGAGPLLNDLTRANLFVSVRALRLGEAYAPTIYEFHALLRQVLRRMANDSWDRAELEARYRAAALELEADHQTEAAAELLFDAQAWPELATLLVKRAPEIFDAGRQQTLSDWLGRLPPALLASEPWLVFWDGACKVMFDPQEGCRAVAQAFAGFEKQDDLEGQFLAWCTIVEAITLEWRDFSGLDNWLSQADRLLASRPYESLPRDLAQRFACVMLSAVIWRQPTRADTEAWHVRALESVSSMLSEGARIQAGVPILVYQLLFRGDHRSADLTYSRMRPTMGISHLQPLDAVVARILDAWFALFRADSRTTIDFAQQGLAYKESHGVTLPGYVLASHEVYARATSGEVMAAAEALERARATEVDPTRLLDVDNAEYQAALIAIQAGRHLDALRIIRATDQTIGTISGPLHWANGAFAEAQALHELGHTSDARRLVDKGLQFVGGGGRFELFDFQATSCLALFDIDEGEESDHNLKRAFEIGARNDILNYLWFRPSMFSKLCARALQRGIEKDYALRLIKRRALLPPFSLEEWPWPVRLSLSESGECKLWLDGRLIEPQRTVSDAPIRLLTALIELAQQVEPQMLDGRALPVRPVDRVQLGKLLRPNDHAASVEDWIHQNLRRLRQRLGSSEVVLSWAGKLAINPLYVWVDVLDRRRWSPPPSETRR